MTGFSAAQPDRRRPSVLTWLGNIGGDWTRDALCPQTDPDAFYPDKGNSSAEAKQVCVMCPVRRECLEFALDHDERYGVWGGLSRPQRRRLKNQIGDHAEGDVRRNTAREVPRRSAGATTPKAVGGMTTEATRHTLITSDGVSLSLREYGSRDAGHTVVLLHGLCLNAASWDIQISQLLKRWGGRLRIISYDHRGHGDSGAAPMSTYRIERLAADLAEVLAYLQITSPLTVAGHSMGGMAALAYLGRPPAERPIEPQGLVLLATAAGRLTERGLGRLLANPSARVLYELVQHAPAAKTDRLVRAVTRPLCTALIRRGAYGAATEHARVAVSAAAINASPLATKVGFLQSLRNFDLYHTLGSITATTVVMSGGADILTPPSHARDIADGIPGASLVYLAAAGHMLMHEAPRAVTAAVAGVIGDPGRGYTRAGVLTAACYRAAGLAHAPITL